MDRGRFFSEAPSPWVGWGKRANEYVAICTFARKSVPLHLSLSLFGAPADSTRSRASPPLLVAHLYSLQFCTGYAPVGQFRRSVDENDARTCTRSDVRNKRHGCIQLINPLSGKYWYDTAYAACKNPGKCDSRKNNIVEQSEEVRDLVLAAEAGLEIATIAQALAIGIAFFLHFIFETVYGGNVFKTKVTWIFFIAKNTMVFLAFCANLYIGIMLLNAEIESADGMGLRDWLSNFIEYECFDAGGTIVLVEVRSFVEETATEMILIAFISKSAVPFLVTPALAGPFAFAFSLNASLGPKRFCLHSCNRFSAVLIDGFIEDNISIVIEGSRDKRIQKLESVFEVVKEATIRRRKSLRVADQPTFNNPNSVGTDDISGMLINNQAFTDEVLNDVLYEDDLAGQTTNDDGYVDVSGYEESPIDEVTNGVQHEDGGAGGVSNEGYMDTPVTEEPAAIIATVPTTDRSFAPEPAAAADTASHTPVSEEPAAIIATVPTTDRSSTPEPAAAADTVSHTFEFAVGDRVEVVKKGLGVVMFAGTHHESGEARYALGLRRSSIVILALLIVALAWVLLSQPTCAVLLDSGVWGLCVQ